MVLLEYNPDKIVEMYEKKQLKFFMVRIIQNQYNSKTSPFYRKYKKYYKYKTPDELVDVKALENQINSNQVSKNKRLVEVAKRVKKLRERRKDER